MHDLGNCVYSIVSGQLVGFITPTQMCILSAEIGTVPGNCAVGVREQGKLAFLTVTHSLRVIRYSLCTHRMPHALWSAPSGYSQPEWSLPVSQCMHPRTVSIEEVNTVLFTVITRPPEGDVVYMNYEPARFFCAYLATTEFLNFPEPLV